MILMEIIVLKLIWIVKIFFKIKMLKMISLNLIFTVNILKVNKFLRFILKINQLI